MDISPELLRDIEFREQWRGYNPDEVDEFLERMAVAVEELRERNRETTERAERAERQVLDAASEDELQRTLVIAQRTADATLAEADAEAERRLAEADERLREAEADAQLRARAELVTLSQRRTALEADVTALRTYVEEQRAGVAARLRGQLAWLEHNDGEALPPPPELRGEPIEPEGEATAAFAVAEMRALAENGDGGDGPDDDASGDQPEATGSATVDVRDHPEGNGALAAAAADDPFLAELRRAVSDDEPLGPRPRLEEPDAIDQPELAGSGSRRRRRRRSAS